MTARMPGMGMWMIAAAVALAVGALGLPAGAGATVARPLGEIATVWPSDQLTIQGASADGEHLLVTLSKTTGDYPDHHTLLAVDAASGQSRQLFSPATPPSSASRPTAIGRRA